MKVFICSDVVFTYSKLGQPFFLRKEAENCLDGISPRDWNPTELRKIADYIESNPDCKNIKKEDLKSGGN